MDFGAYQAVKQYAEAFQKLYNRQPRELRLVSEGWVLVNGAKMRIADLEFLTAQLQREYQRSQNHRRGIVTRLIAWMT
jgi:hypothetical protein